MQSLVTARDLTRDRSIHRAQFSQDLHLCSTDRLTTNYLLLSFYQSLTDLTTDRPTIFFLFYCQPTTDRPTSATSIVYDTTGWDGISILRTIRTMRKIDPGEDWRLQPNGNERINRVEEEKFVTRDCIGSTIDCLTETMMV